jgi:hypothetical protein
MITTFTYANLVAISVLLAALASAVYQTPASDCQIPCNLTVHSSAEQLSVITRIGMYILEDHRVMGDKENRNSFICRWSYGASSGNGMRLMCAVCGHIAWGIIISRCLEKEKFRPIDLLPRSIPPAKLKFDPSRQTNLHPRPTGVIPTNSLWRKL